MTIQFPPTEDATVRIRMPPVPSHWALQLTRAPYADHHPTIAPPVNPERGVLVRCPSSGSGVATAAGLCYGSLGSDTGGSIRFPSAANGVTGLKPTWGRVSRHGVFELAATLDHIGPMARSAADCGALLGAIAGGDRNDPTALPDPVPNYLAGMTRGLRGLRIGVDRAWNTTGIDPDTITAVTAARDSARPGRRYRDVTTRCRSDHRRPVPAVRH
jgi:amidase